MGPPMPQARLRRESSILYGNAVDYSHSCNKNRSISNNSYLYDSHSTSSREYLTPPDWNQMTEHDTRNRIFPHDPVAICIERMTYYLSTRIRTLR